MPGKKRQYRKRRMNKKTGGKVSVANREEVCRIKETVTLESLVANTPYEAVVSLPAFQRALDIADNFQLYRITKIDFKFTPSYDTFASQYQPGTSNASMTVPYLYNKRITYPAPTTFGLSFLQTMGAKPRRLDDKTLTVSYTPNINLNVVGVNASNQLLNAKPQMSPWLNTHYIDLSNVTQMDTTPHYGFVWYIHQLQATLGQQVNFCELQMTAHFEFKKPWDKSALVPPPGTPDKILLTGLLEAK